MLAYFIRRLLLIIPTLLGILTLNFLIIQAAPGGPVEQTLAKLQQLDVSATANITGQADTFSGAVQQHDAIYRASQGMDPELVQKIEKLYFFKPGIKYCGNGDVVVEAVQKSIDQCGLAGTDIAHQQQQPPVFKDAVAQGGQRFFVRFAQP